MKRKRETLFNKYKDLMGENTTLIKKFHVLLEEIVSMQNDSHLTTTVLHDIKESMMCSICLDSRYEDKPVVVSSCGHVLHKECYEGQKTSMGDTCCKCMKKNQSWFPFTGYTGITAVLKKLQTARDAQ
jgi:hypothetical protein